MNALLLLLQLITILLYSNSHVIANRRVDYCFADEHDPYLYMATKTAYHFVLSDNAPFQTVSNCRALQIWMLATHGTHYPTLDEIDDIIDLDEFRQYIVYNHEVLGGGHMCNHDLNNLKNWKPYNLSMKRSEILTLQGIEDMKLFAIRLQSYFPELLIPFGISDITSSNFKFQSIKAYHSMVSFAAGLFGSGLGKEILPEDSSSIDTILSAYRTCGVSKNNTNQQAPINTKHKIFENKLEFQNLLQKVSRRLGFLYDISIQRLNAMYNVCRYEKAWDIWKLSPWCAVFTKEELRILEYREDLKYYYKAGYGRESNAHLGCPLLYDMMQHFRNITHNETSNPPKAIFYFSNIISLQNLLTTMGINKDRTHLTGYNYKDMAKRQWRTSFISSFAANLFAVFYKCNDKDDKDRNKVMFYLSENPVQYEGCQEGLCDWEFLKTKFGQQSSNCKLYACWNENAAFSSLSSLSLVAISCFVLVRLG